MSNVYVLLVFLGIAVVCLGLNIKYLRRKKIEKPDDIWVLLLRKDRAAIAYYVLLAIGLISAIALTFSGV